MLTIGEMKMRQANANELGPRQADPSGPDNQGVEQRQSGATAEQARRDKRIRQAANKSRKARGHWKGAFNGLGFW